MGQDFDLVFRQYISNIEVSLERFAQRVNEQLFAVTDELDHSQANLRLLEKKPSNLNTDKNIVLASLFYACYANSEQIGLGLPNHDPNIPHSTGIKILEAEKFRLDCYETLTKVKFVVISDLSLGMSPATANKQELLKRIYELYADYVMKNPFYTLNMPINSDNCSLFKTNLELSLSGNMVKPGQVG